jgi:hypothetical protein
MFTPFPQGPTTKPFTDSPTTQTTPHIIHKHSHSSSVNRNSVGHASTTHSVNVCTLNPPSLSPPFECLWRILIHSKLICRVDVWWERKIAWWKNRWKGRCSTRWTCPNKSFCQSRSTGAISLFLSPSTDFLRKISSRSVVFVDS